MSGAPSAHSIAVGLLTTLGSLVIFFMRARGGRLADLGLGRPATLPGWMTAGAVTALFVGLMLAGPLRGRAARRRRPTP